MIKSFKHKGLERFYRNGSKAGITAIHAARLQDILGALDAAVDVNDMDAPGFRLHLLKGKQLRGHWAVSVNGPWRVTFRFDRGDAHVVDYRQYH